MSHLRDENSTVKKTYTISKIMLKKIKLNWGRVFIRDIISDYIETIYRYYRDIISDSQITLHEENEDIFINYYYSGL